MFAAGASLFAGQRPSDVAAAASTAAAPTGPAQAHQGPARPHTRSQHRQNLQGRLPAALLHPERHLLGALLGVHLNTTRDFLLHFISSLSHFFLQFQTKKEFDFSSF